MHDFTIRSRRPLVLAGLTLLLFAATPSPTQAQDQANAPVRADASKFSPAQIEQIAAPIALYPDPLLAQIFMASTYPLEVVEADRWRKKNPTLSGSGLEAGLKEQEWDPSVKSLCTFPSLLARMSENLDWTQDLGDAFLGQREELMKSIQALRKKAKDAGQLQTNEQQKIIVEGDTIVVQPVNPDVVYVPTYPPTWFYGPSYGYPYYYPVMYPPCPPPGNPWCGFGAGIIVGGAIWGDCNWGNSDVDVDIDHHNNFTKNNNVNRGDRVEHYNKDGRGKGKWNHDSAHRKGVNYKNAATRDKVGAGANSKPRVSTNDARGRGNAGGANSPKPAARPSTQPAAKPAARPAASAPKPAAPKASGGALNGSRNTNMDRAASSRGAASRGNAGARGGGARPSGGARGGGGSRGGGGGGRRR